MLKDQRYQFEMHTRNWKQGGYIVSRLILYIKIFLFPLTPNVYGFFSVQPFWFPLSNFNQVFKVDDNVEMAWSMWEYLNSQKFYMGTHPGPTIETSGSIILAERPEATSTRPKAGPTAAPTTPRRPQTPERTGIFDFHISVWSFKIFLYFKFFLNVIIFHFPPIHFMLYLITLHFSLNFQDTSVLQVFLVSWYFISLQYIH